jgi:hypothetical protein
MKLLFALLMACSIACPVSIEIFLRRDNFTVICDEASVYYKDKKIRCGCGKSPISILCLDGEIYAYCISCIEEKFLCDITDIQDFKPVLK